MHSRIYEISTKPIPQDEHMTDNDFDYDHWFFRDVADYVTDDENRESSIQWLLDSLVVGNGLISIDGDSFLLHEGFHAAYWDGRYCAFIRRVEALHSITSTEFAQGGASMMLYQAEQLHEEKFGFYVVVRDGDNDSLVTMDEFVRHAKVGVQYYVGGTIDYHC